MVTADVSAEWGTKEEYPTELKETPGCSERSGVQKRAGKDSVRQPEGLNGLGCRNSFHRRTRQTRKEPEGTML